MPERPRLRVFRILVSSRNLEASQRFYRTLLGTAGRRVAEGRVYFDCGSVILGIVEGAAGGAEDQSTEREAIYFATRDLEAVHRRARRLGCLEGGCLHDDPASPMGEIVVRPWGERSFYALDPDGNPLCFVDSRTLFKGTASQVAALRRRA